MKMFFEVFLLIAVLVVLIYLVFSFAPKVLSPSNPFTKGSVCIKEKCFSAEIASAPAQREKGLMNVAKMDKDKGMLFIFDKEGFYPFWMKNTLIPLDIIWIGANNEVVFIKENAQPCKTLLCPQIAPSGKAKYVLEINAGLSREFGFEEGDLCDIIE